MSDQPLPFDAAPRAPAAPAEAPAPGTTATPGSGWRGRLATQWRHHQPLKIVGICLFTWAFFVAYFHLLRHPGRAPTVMPLTALDHLMPFVPEAIWAYASLWIYVGIAPALQPSLGAYARYGVWVAALCVAGLGLFWLWPTAVPWPGAVVEAAAASHAGLAMIRGMDAAGNACPSLHVATAMFSACWIDRMLRAIASPAWLRGLSLVWLAAIVWSTLALRQHVAIDVAAGAALGWAFAALSLRWGPAPGAARQGQPL